MTKAAAKKGGGWKASKANSQRTKSALLKSASAARDAKASRKRMKQRIMNLTSRLSVIESFLEVRRTEIGPFTSAVDVEEE